MTHILPCKRCPKSGNMPIRLKTMKDGNEMWAVACPACGYLVECDNHNGSVALWNAKNSDQWPNV